MVNWYTMRSRQVKISFTQGIYSNRQQKKQKNVYIYQDSPSQASAYYLMNESWENPILSQKNM